MAAKRPATSQFRTTAIRWPFETSRSVDSSRASLPAGFPSSPQLRLHPAIGCATDESTAPASSNELTPTTPPVALSADWLNGSVTWLDLDQLVAPNGTLEKVLIDRLDLSPEGQQGPLYIVSTADGRRAVVLLSPGGMAFVGGRLGVDIDSLPSSEAAVVI